MSNNGNGSDGDLPEKVEDNWPNGKATRFKKGFDPRRNLKGRPKRKTYGELMYDEGHKLVDKGMLAKINRPDLEGITKAEFIVLVAYQRAMAGDIRHLGLIIERVDGKVPLPITIDGDISMTYNFENLSDAELNDFERILTKSSAPEPRRGTNGEGATQSA